MARMRQLKKTQVITKRDSKSVEKYLKDINRYSLVSFDEEVKLAQMIRKGGDEAQVARNKLVEANLRFVVSVANHFARSDVEFADLISEGNIGLIKAVENYDYTRGFKFSTYAVWWIRQQIMYSLDEKQRMIRLPLNIQNALSKYKRFSEEILQKEYRYPSLSEFAEEFGISDKMARDIEAVLERPDSLDKPVSGDIDSTLVDTVESDSDTGRSLFNEDLATELEVLLHRLAPKERDVIIRTFGIGMAEQTLDECALSIGLSKERVRQIRAEALTKLRKMSGGLNQYL